MLGTAPIFVRPAADERKDREGSPFQAAAFVSAWTTSRPLRTDCETWLLVSPDRAAALPIEITRHGPLRIGRFPGETHANANGWTRAPGKLPPRLSGGDIAAAAIGAGIRLDALDLRRIAEPGWLGSGFTVTAAFEERFAISLKGGIEAVIERGNAKRKRKKFRAQQRHFADTGGYRFLDVPRSQRPATLDLFLVQKSRRFQAMGIPDPFAEPGIRDFLLALFDDPAADSRLYIIENGAEPKALLGGIVAGDTFWGMFSSYADDADASISPGELLLWHMVERLAEEGLSYLDLGPGDERYKRSWCDRVMPQVDAMLALTLRGKVYVAGAALAARARDAVKRHAGLRSVVQRLRRRLHAANPVAD